MELAFDRSKSLQELEGKDWGEPTYDSYLVTTCHRLRRKPLAEFTTEDLRIMIGQDIGLPYLIPLAIERLLENPLIHGDMFTGDLLLKVLDRNPRFWREHPELWSEAYGVLFQVEILDRAIDKILASRRKFDHALDTPAEENNSA